MVLWLRWPGHRRFHQVEKTRIACGHKPPRRCGYRFTGRDVLGARQLYVSSAHARSKILSEKVHAGITLSGLPDALWE